MNPKYEIVEVVNGWIIRIVGDISVNPTIYVARDIAMVGEILKVLETEDHGETTGA